MSILGSIVGGILGAGAADKAADAQVGAATSAQKLLGELWGKQQGFQNPYLQGGATAQNRLLELLGLGGDQTAEGYGSLMQPFSMEQFQQDPGYGFRLDEGLKSLDRQAAARGGLISGGALKAAQRYGQDMASNEYTNAFNRYQTERQNQLGALTGLTGAGQNAANVLTGAAGSYGNSMADLYTNIGNARASGYINKANSMTGALGGIEKSIGLGW